MRHRTLGTIAMLMLAASLSGCLRGGGPTAVPTDVPPAAVAVAGRVHAGPVCPVVRPGDPACADRAVAGAVLVVLDASGAEIGRAISAADGSFTLELPPGDYRLVPQPVFGLLGTAPPVTFTVGGPGAAAPAPLDVSYDTGIR